MTRTRAAAAALLVTAAVAACASNRAATEPPLELGRIVEEARALDSDSSLWNNDAALFRAALAHALPQSSLYRPAQAREYLDRLIQRFPRSPRREEALHLDAVLSEVARLDSHNTQSEVQIQRLDARVDSLQARLEDQRQASSQLQADIHRRDVQIKALQDELERLKAIDLKLVKPGSTATRSN